MSATIISITPRLRRSRKLSSVSAALGPKRLVSAPPLKSIRISSELTAFMASMTERGRP